MHQDIVFRIRKAAVLLPYLAATLCAASAFAEEGPCSNRTLRGSYAFSVEGMILAIPGAPALPSPLPLRAVALTTFDGKGNLEQVDHYVVAGGPPPQDWQPSSGTYVVNANCTGVMTLIVPGNPLSPFVSYFILTKKGKQIRTVLNANQVSSVGVLVERVHVTDLAIESRQ